LIRGDRFDHDRSAAGGGDRAASRHPHCRQPGGTLFAREPAQYAWRTPAICLSRHQHIFRRPLRSRSRCKARSASACWPRSSTSASSRARSSACSTFAVSSFASRQTTRAAEGWSTRSNGLKSGKNLDVSDQRTQSRFVPSDPCSTLLLADGTVRTCFLIDVSVSGAAVSADFVPEIGTVLAVGKAIGAGDASF